MDVIRTATLIGMLLVAGTFTAVLAFSNLGGPFVSSKVPEAEAVAEATPTHRATIPPIDAAAPAETETATFALG